MLAVGMWTRAVIVVLMGAGTVVWYACADRAAPSDDGYGMPNATIYGDADGDGLLDDPAPLLGLTVQKYGRTTRLMAERRKTGC